MTLPMLDVSAKEETCRTYEPLVVRRIGKDELARIAEIHGEAFPESALTILGSEAIQRYYDWQFSDAHSSVVLGVFDSGVLVGYCVGGTFNGSLGGFLERDRLWLMSLFLRKPGVLLRAEVRKRIGIAVITLMRRAVRRSADRSTSRPREREFGILAIATSIHYQGKGVGKMLMKEMEEIAKRDGFEAVSLTVHPDNTPAVRFYERLGWRRYADEAHWAGIMKKEI